MNAAPAGEGDEVGLLVGPLCQRERPLPCPPDLEDLLAGEDHAAVDDPDDEGREVACRHRDHRLVEECEAVLNPPRLHEHVTLRVHCDREEVAVAEALPDRCRLTGDGRSSLEVAGRLVTEHERDEQIALLGRFPGPPVEEPLRPCEPAAAGPTAPRWARLMPIQVAARTAGNVSSSSRYRW